MFCSKSGIGDPTIPDGNTTSPTNNILPSSAILHNLANISETPIELKKSVETTTQTSHHGVNDNTNTFIESCDTSNIDTTISKQTLDKLFKFRAKAEISGNTVIYIRKHSQDSKVEGYLVRKETELNKDGKPDGMNISILLADKDEVASGRCSIQKDPDKEDFLHISAVYVEGNNNYPTKTKPNKYIGLGRVLVYEAIKLGYENNIKTALITPLEGSAIFYLKMGFIPKVEGNPNRMPDYNSVVQCIDNKLNSDWMKNFEQASFLNDKFRSNTWIGDIALIYDELQKQISDIWEIK